MVNYQIKQMKKNVKKIEKCVVILTNKKLGTFTGLFISQ